MIVEGEIKTYDQIIDLLSEYEKQVMALDNGKMFYYYENCLNRDVRIFFTVQDAYTIQIFCPFNKFWDVCNYIILNEIPDTPEEFRKIVKNYDLVYRLKNV